MGECFISRRGGRLPGGSEFGTGADGNVVISANIVLPVAVPFQTIVEKNYRSLTINAGATLSCAANNAGLVIRVKGDCIIHGTIDQSCKSPKPNPSNNWPYPTALRCGNGGHGGMTVHDATHNAGHINYGLGMAGMQYGGGWSGGGGHGDGYDYDDGSIYYVAGGSANGITVATPEIFVGGKGWNSGVTTSAGQYGGGAGGYSRNSYTGGSGGSGPGGNGGKGGQSTSMGRYNGCGAGNFGGGVVLLYVAGNLVIDGSILCAGGNGGNGGYASSYTYTTAASGGGGGGGGIYILYGLSYKNTGNLNVSGGTYGNGPLEQRAAVLGTSGAPGTITVVKK